MHTRMYGKSEHFGKRSFISDKVSCMYVSTNNLETSQPSRIDFFHSRFFFCTILRKMH